MGTLGVAIVGTGMIGAVHRRAAVLAGAVVRGVAASSPERAREVAQAWGAGRGYAGIEEVVADPQVQVVHICTPNHLHRAMAEAALGAGKHVVCEKPLATTLEDARALAALAASSGLVATVPFVYRYHPVVREARARIAAGDLGPLRLIHGSYLQDWLLDPASNNWRVDPALGGASRVFADIGSHWCDLVQFVTGRRITRVFADLFRVHETRRRPTEAAETFRSGQGATEAVPVETEDGANVLLQFEGGARGAVVISQVSAGRKNREWVEIDGSRCALAWDQERPNALWVGRREGPNETLIKDPGLLDPSARPFAHYPGGHPEGYPDGFKNHFLAVYRAVRDGLPAAPDFPTFADGLRAVRLVEAVLTSHREGRWVDV